MASIQDLDNAYGFDLNNHEAYASVTNLAEAANLARYIFDVQRIATLNDLNTANSAYIYLNSNLSGDALIAFRIEYTRRALLFQRANSVGGNYADPEQAYLFGLE
ncbi:MAG: hypothetical protein MI920_37940 [Kiloniellales bacterium]|nr:hypothetical protein [Kiloniellales bacterium]